jgi:hypothetical protein
MEKPKKPFCGSGRKNVGIWTLLKAGAGRFEKSDPDLDKNRPDPQHWYRQDFLQFKYSVSGRIFDYKNLVSCQISDINIGPFDRDSTRYFIPKKNNMMPNLYNTILACDTSFLSDCVDTSIYRIQFALWQISLRFSQI